MKSLVRFSIALALTLVLVPAAFATNGMEATASGARAAGMGGVDIAIATDATAMNTNPAGLTQLLGHRIDFGTALLIPIVHFKNDLNDKDGVVNIFPMPMIAYGYRFQNVPIALGLGVFTQGGMGAEFKLDHAIAGQDADYFSTLGYMKLAPTIAYQPHEMVSLGGAFNLGWAQMGMKMPFAVHPSIMTGRAMRGGSEVSFGSLFENMLGYDELTAMAELENANAFGFGGKLGILITPHEVVSLGLAYTFQTTLTFHGDAKMDMQGQFDDALPKMVDAFQLMPSVDTPQQAEQAVMEFFQENGVDPERGYAANYDAEVEFAWPRKLAFGVAVRPLEQLLMGVDVTWINWSATMEKFKMTLSNGDNDNINKMIGGDKVVAEIPLKWEDQLVFAFGTQYEFLPGAFARVGYNYGKNPVPDDTVFAVFPAIVEHHITLGGGYNVKDFFEVNAAYEYAVSNTQTASSDHQIAAEYDNSESTLGEHLAHVMFSFAF
ncbi:MAG: outer membrane protein transport protein [Candidatus Lernaella stagnicola]|nr:outer membrane protein transport protein [Candidatus Lernaella stagnicola]